MRKKDDCDEGIDDQAKRHGLRKQLKLLRLSNMKLKKQLRRMCSVRCLNRTRLEGEVLELNALVHTLRNQVCGEHLNGEYETQKLYGNPQSSSKTVAPESAEKNSEAAYRFFCDKCTFRCKKRTPYDIHMRRHSGLQPFQCTECNKTFVAKYELKLHSAKHSNSNQYFCQQCQFSTYRSDILVNHMKKHLASELQICQQCNFKTDIRSKMISHRKKHIASGSQPGDGPKTSDTSKYHQPLARGKDTLNPEHKANWICDICGNIFVKKESLRKHLRLHSGERPFHCDRCCYSAATKHTLTVHLRRHSTTDLTEKHGVSVHLC